MRFPQIYFDELEMCLKTPSFFFKIYL